MRDARLRVEDPGDKVTLAAEDEEALWRHQGSPTGQEGEHS
jgi:hypothetical protein